MDTDTWIHIKVYNNAIKGVHMGKIAFIAPFEEILAAGQKVITDLGISDKIKCYLGMHSSGVEIAHKIVNNGTDVIVSRGGTAELIEKSGMEIPVVTIPITFQDLAEALLNAKKLTGFNNPKIAVMAFKNMIYSIEVFARVMEVELKIYKLDKEEEIPDLVEQAIRDNPDVLVGGKITTELATNLGVKTILLASGNDSFRTAFKQAEKLSDVRRLEKERMQKFRVLVDYSTQGIISVDSDKRIEVFNNSAEKFLDYKAVEVTGKNIDFVCPSLPVDRCLKDGKEILGELIKINNRKVITNIIPIGEDISGAMITIEDVGRIVEMEAAIRKDIYSKGLSAQYYLKDILGLSPQIVESKRVAQEYSGVDATVLIIGPSGTGKELFAQGIHNASKRRQKPFVAVNCGAIPANLLESELFGYVEGAFTGANKKGKAGFFELAHGGTIFLDEIGEMDKVAQTSLLRVIQERRIMRLGDDKYIPVDVRIVAATNKNLTNLVKEGQFREDLYYRINVLPLELPALKSRAGDSVYLADHFIDVYNRMFGRKVALSDEAKAYMNSYDWPGNIRQLRNAMERLVLITKGDKVSPELVATMLGIPVEAKEEIIVERKDDDLSEKARILRALSEAGYNQKEAAKKLGIDRSTLYRKLKALNIEVKKICNT
jgi:PAS domain S-box-containing protein